MSKKIKISLLVLFAVLTSGLGWYMSQLQFWEYLPLFLGISGWGLILMIREKHLRHQNHRYLMMALASGVLLSIGFPPLPFILSMFFGFVPLLWIEHSISKNYAVGGKQLLFKYGYITFITWNILTTYWVMNASLISGIFAISVNSLLMTFPLLLFRWVKQIYGDRLGYTSFASFWLFFEYFHLRWDLSWPWLTLGNSMAKFPQLAQWYEYTGILGGSLWILAANLGVFFILRPRFDRTYKVRIVENRKLLLGVILGILIPCIFSVVLYQQNKTNPNTETVEVVSIQPNYEPHYEKFRVGERIQLEKFKRLMSEQVDEKTDYVIFPETSFGNIWHEKIGQGGVLLDLQRYIRPYPNLKLVTGLTSFEKLDPKKGLPSTARSYGKGESGFYYNAYNSAVQLNGDTSKIPIHVKGKLVPGAELMPFSKYLSFVLEPLMSYFGGTASGLGVSEQVTNFPINETQKVGTIICYESIYGEYVTQYVQRGANLLFVITNDGWWGNTAGHRQHLNFSSLRAIETRRSIARSANTGISAFFNTRGDILEATPYEEDAAIKANLTLNDEITFYTIYGDFIGRLAGFLSVLLMLTSWVRKRVVLREK